MFIDHLSLLNFKNIAQAELDFCPSFNCLTGPNGAGKTNVIDAIYYLSMCKSAFGMTDGQCIMRGNEFFMIAGQYGSDGGLHDSVTCSFKRAAGKSIRRAGKEYERLSDHIGLVPVVIVSPNDVFLVNDAADERRRWLNSFISQSDGQYLAALMRYNRLLADRNRLLKTPDPASQRDLIEVIDSRLVEAGELIANRRSEAIERLRPEVEGYYRSLSGDSEQAELSYRSELSEGGFADLLRDSWAKDVTNGFTTSGIHRDDMVMRIGDFPLRRYGSQGQQKSFLIALKLAQYNLTATLSGERPILLLDDVFDKLDADRLGRLIELTKGGRFGQIVITDCNRERMSSVLEQCGTEYRLFTVNGGNIEGE